MRRSNTQQGQKRRHEVHLCRYRYMQLQVGENHNYYYINTTVACPCKTQLACVMSFQLQGLSAIAQSLIRTNVDICRSRSYGQRILEFPC